MKVSFTKTALADLAGIAEWIAEDNPARADSFADEIFARCQSLAEFPERYHQIMAGDNTSIRKMSYSGYLVLYQILKAEVQILRIVHGSRDWASLFDSI